MDVDVWCVVKVWFNSLLFMSRYILFSAVLIVFTSADTHLWIVCGFGIQKQP